MKPKPATNVGYRVNIVLDKKYFCIFFNKNLHLNDFFSYIYIAFL